MAIIRAGKRKLSLPPKRTAIGLYKQDIQGESQYNVIAESIRAEEIKKSEKRQDRI